MRKKTENYFRKLIDKHICDQLNRNDYFDFCLKYTRDHIIESYNNKFPCKDVITELFKRGMAEKYRVDNPDYKEKAKKYEKEWAKRNAIKNEENKGSI